MHLIWTTKGPVSRASKGGNRLLGDFMLDIFLYGKEPCHRSEVIPRQYGYKTFLPCAHRQSCISVEDCPALELIERPSAIPRSRKSTCQLIHFEHLAAGSGHLMFLSYFEVPHLCTSQPDYCTIVGEERKMSSWIGISFAEEIIQSLAASWYIRQRLSLGDSLRCGRMIIEACA